MQHAVLNYLLNAGWQLALIGACAFVLSRLLKLAPAQACWLWLAAFGLAVLGPLLAASPGGADAVRTQARDHGLLTAWQNIVITDRPAMALTIGFWLCLAAAALRLVASCTVAIGLVKASREVWLPDEVRESLEDFCRQHGRAMPRIHTCSHITSPVVVGVRRPYVLVPPAVLAEGPDALRPALLHELAHVMRGDYAANLMVELFALPLAWHPMLYAIKAMIRLTREQSCDAMAAARIGCRHRYAQSLLALARQAIAPRDESGTAVALFGDDDLGSRIAMLATGGERRRLSGIPAAATLATFLLLGVAVISVHLCALVPIAAPVVTAAANPPAFVMPVPHVRPFRPVRTARAELPSRKPRMRAHGKTDVMLAAQTAPTPRPTEVATEVVAQDPGAGGAGPFDFLQTFQFNKYRTVFSP